MSFTIMSLVQGMMRVYACGEEAELDQGRERHEQKLVRVRALMNPPEDEAADSDEKQAKILKIQRTKGWS